MIRKILKDLLRMIKFEAEKREEENDIMLHASKNQFERGFPINHPEDKVETFEEKHEQFMTLALAGFLCKLGHRVTAISPEEVGAEAGMRLSEWLEAFSFLRPSGSLHHIPRMDSWLVLGHSLVEEITKDTATFSNKVYKPFEDRLLGTDPSEHTMMRSAIQPNFLPKSIKGLEEFALNEMDRRIHSVGNEIEFDIVGLVCKPLVLSINGRLLGLTEVEVEAIINELKDGESHETHRKVEELFTNVLTCKERATDEGSLLAVLSGIVDKRLITSKEAVGLMKLVWNAGSATSYGLLSHLTYILLTRSDLSGRLLKDAGLVQRFVEETLRLHPTPIIIRTATRDVIMEGKKIQTGSTVMVSLIAANRDPSVFEDADEFQLDRPLRKHFAFGNGPHHCLGSHVARLVFSVFVRKMLSVVDRIELSPAHTPDFICTSDFNGAASLTVRWK